MTAWVKAWRDWRGKKPGAVYRKVRQRTKVLAHVALYDYIDNAGTAMAGAVYKLRKDPNDQVALLEARQQHEMLWALIDEAADRQRAAL